LIIDDDTFLLRETAAGKADDFHEHCENKNEDKIV